jgi:hypothetical protein
MGGRNKVLVRSAAFAESEGRIEILNWWQQLLGANTSVTMFFVGTEIRDWRG